MKDDFSQQRIANICRLDKKSLTDDDKDYYNYWKGVIKDIKAKKRADRTKEEQSLYKEWQMATWTEERRAKYEANKIEYEASNKAKSKKKEIAKEIKTDVINEIVEKKVVQYSRGVDYESKEDVKKFLIEFIEKDLVGVYTSIDEVISVQPYDIASAVKAHKLDKDDEVKWCVSRRLALYRATSLRSLMDDPKTASTAIKIIASDEQRNKLSAAWKPSKKEENTMSQIKVVE